MAEDKKTEQEQPDELRVPSDEEMKGWQIDPVDEGPAPVTGTLTEGRAKALRKRVDEARTDAADESGVGIKPAMSEEELRAAGVGVDLPTEAASEDPKGIAYNDGTTLEGRLEQRRQEGTVGKRTSNGDGGSPEGNSAPNP